MATKDEALQLLESLPDDCSWDDVLQAVSTRARQVRELRSVYGPPDALSQAGGSAVHGPSHPPEGSTEMGYQARITLEPGKRSGRPCIRGLRITVSDVLDYLAAGMSEDEILDDFPDLQRDDIRACLAFAADSERRLMRVLA